MVIECLSAAQGETLIDELSILLRDAVEGGASVGFVTPPERDDAHHYRQEVLEQAGAESRLLLVDREGDRVLGSVQLELPGKPNDRHRVELQKLLVLRSARRQVRGLALIGAVEREALSLGRTLIVLDTRDGDIAESVYRRAGYTVAGRIPGYALNSDGIPIGTVIYYRLLQDGG